MRTILIKDEQNIYDVALQEYGSADAAFQLIDDNEDIESLDHIFIVGDKVFIDDTVIFDDTIKNTFASRGIIPTMGEEIDLGDFNNDFNDDFSGGSPSPTGGYTNIYSMLFDGTGEKFIDVGVVSDFSFIQNTGVFSVSLWFKMSDFTDGTNRYFMGNQNSGTQKGFRIQYTASNDSLKVILSNGTSNIINSDSAANIIADNNWHNLVITGDGTNIRFYLDNVKTTGTGTMGTLSTGDSTEELAIANLRESGTDTFLGNLDELAIFNSTLTDGDVSAIYNTGIPTDLVIHAKAADLELYYKIDDAIWDGSKFDVPDSSGQGLDSITSQMEEADKVTDTP